MVHIIIMLLLRPAPCGLLYAAHIGLLMMLSSTADLMHATLETGDGVLLELFTCFKYIT